MKQSATLSVCHGNSTPFQCHNGIVCHTVTSTVPHWNNLPHCKTLIQYFSRIKKKCIPHVVVLKQGVIHNHLTPFQSWIISMDFSYYYHIGIPITKHCCRALNTQHAGNTENWLHFINNPLHNHHPLHQTPLTLCSASPMRQTARKVGTQRLNSAIQLASVDLGQMTRWGDGMLR